MKSHPANATTAQGAVAIIGAGQLGRMLAEAAVHLGYMPHVLAKDPGEPAAQVRGARVIRGDIGDQHALAELLAPCALVTFESELTPPPVIAAAAAYRRVDGTSVAIEPSPDVMAVCGDKLRQKELLTRLAVPTARFEALPRDQSSDHYVITWLEGLTQRFAGGSVLKWARGGYDGRGTLVYRGSPEELAAALEFVLQATARGSSVYAESFVPFTAELAVVTSRSTTGELVQYPPVLTTQTNGICTEVVGPAAALGLSPGAIADALTFARRIGESLKIAGTFAVEFFVQADGSVVVNEIAPRVHNSGHFTLNGAVTSQFENHWRGVLGLPLGSTETHPYFGMINLIGWPGFVGQVPEGFSPQEPKVSSYWYGKAEVRPGRKVGHVNLVADSASELRRRIELVKVEIGAWQSRLTREQA